MTWIKHALIDVAASLLIVLAVTLDLTWARWIVLIYTPLMLVLKLVAFLGRHSLGQLKQTSAEVPFWFYHVLYAVNVLVPAVGGWWVVAAGWALIWFLSMAADGHLRPARA